MNSTIEKVIEDSKGFGSSSQERLEAFLKSKLKHYSEVLDIPEEEIFQAWEKRRSYTAVNFYQESNFPALEEVKIYLDWDELAALIPSKKFRCCTCQQITTNPYECNSGHVDEDGKVCDWKTYGLFKTFGKGLRFTLKDTFLEQGGLIDEIFMPIEFEEVKNDA